MIAGETFFNLREEIRLRLSRLSTKKTEKRERIKKEMVLDLWLHIDVSTLTEILIDTNRKDKELEEFSRKAGVPGLFEDIRKEIIKLEDAKEEHSVCYDPYMDDLVEIFIDSASKMEEAGREDIEVLLAIIAEQIDESRYP